MKILHAYTDGSCNPNPGYSGYGIHIAIGDDEVKPKVILGKYTLTDKGYFLRTDVKKYDLKETGFINGIEINGYFKTSNTNNQGELDAIITIVENIDILLSKLEYEIDEIRIYSDSTYSIGHVANILDGSIDIDEVNSNKGHVLKLKTCLENIMGNKDITIHKVPAHADNLGNNRADMLANMGRFMNMREEKESGQFMIIEDKDFWKLPTLDLDMFFFKQIFNFQGDGTDTYYGLNYKKESDMGKKIGYVTYSIIKLEEPYSLINDIVSFVRKTLQDTYVPYIVKLAEFTNKTVLMDYLRYGERFLITENKAYLSIKTLMGNEIARVLYPTGLSNIVMENMYALETELDKFINDAKSELTTYIDITDEIFEVNEKDKLVIKPDILNDKFILKYKLPDTVLKIKMRYDLPPRNTLKRIEGKNPKVILVVTDRGHMYEYKTITIIDGRDYIINDNIYANKVMKKKKKEK